MRSKNKSGYMENRIKNGMQVSHGQLLIWKKRCQLEVCMRQTFQNIMIQSGQREAMTIG